MKSRHIIALAGVVLSTFVFSNTYASTGALQPDNSSGSIKKPSIFGELLKDKNVYIKNIWDTIKEKRETYSFLHAANSATMQDNWNTFRSTHASTNTSWKWKMKKGVDKNALQVLNKNKDATVASLDMLASDVFHHPERLTASGVTASGMSLPVILDTKIDTLLKYHQDYEAYVATGSIDAYRKYVSDIMGVHTVNNTLRKQTYDQWVDYQQLKASNLSRISILPQSVLDRVATKLNSLSTSKKIKAISSLQAQVERKLVEIPQSDVLSQSSKDRQMAIFHQIQYFLIDALDSM